jgi:hypothetical protein
LNLALAFTQKKSHGNELSSCAASMKVALTNIKPSEIQFLLNSLLVDPYPCKKLSELYAVGSYPGVYSPLRDPQ